jgi:hypothetical protein
MYRFGSLGNAAAFESLSERRQSSSSKFQNTARPAPPTRFGVGSAGDSGWAPPWSAKKLVGPHVEERGGWSGGVNDRVRHRKHVSRQARQQLRSAPLHYRVHYSSSCEATVTVPVLTHPPLNTILTNCSAPDVTYGGHTPPSASIGLTSLTQGHRVSSLHASWDSWRTKESIGKVVSSY